ncbi:MAG: DNA/RNA nuclease SfsA [Clostridia bacterium]|nr:DNA/RNA nuclease SfsA [Clostridia bacterium]
MQYKRIVEGRFISRPNRFVAIVSLDGEDVAVHVKNTGRCKELLTDGAVVYLEDSMNDQRKLRYSLVAVRKGDILVNIDSQAPNAVAKEWLVGGKACLDGLSGLDVVKAEQTFGKSRFDFYIKDKEGREGYLEVKGVTLESNGVVAFPDAPTERGVKHINELIEAKRQGYYAGILFVVQMDGVSLFTPNDITHKAFGDALRRANAEGVEIVVKTCKVAPDSLEISKDLPVNLSFYN